MFQAQCLHQNKSGNCVGYVCFVYQRFELFYTWKTRVCVTLHAQMFLWYRLNGWMHSKQTGEKQVDKLKGRGIRVVEQLQKTFDWMRLNGWRAEENFCTAFAHSHSFTNKKQTCEWRHNNNSRSQVGKIMKKKLPSPWNSKQSQVFNHADF